MAKSFTMLSAFGMGGKMVVLIILSYEAILWTIMGASVENNEPVAYIACALAVFGPMLFGPAFFRWLNDRPRRLEEARVDREIERRRSGN
ncbi:hypothetical protein [Cryobacterium sp. CG_9.6]|uniref:hypothetical protein n=1 Tax=Cryobacterium sp. CG_9.6 TaxID=2760710 RepID=UPI0024762847|nr:hypothetical protein [Cryobacterium sp. CG_9.6]MDH6238231.1 hypothetical protein [Cryobacterium sp. CG_9.6]